MTMLLTFLTIELLLTFGGGVPVPVLTICSLDGDLVDCIKTDEQPTLQDPLFKTHQFLEVPTNHVPYTTKDGDKYGWQVWHQNGTRCPEGSIPFRRISTYNKEIPSLSSEERATNGHEYATGMVENVTSIYGTQVTMNVWQPMIEGSEEFSLGQTWLSSGSYKDNTLNTIEAGWETDAYTETHCYNVRCPGFVQTSGTIMVEGAINGTSIFGGAQVDLTIRIWKDQKLGCWWLGVILPNGILEPVGYWPTFIFTRLTDHANIVKWGGEITNRYPFGRHTKTQMGSGFFPDAGYGKAAYMRNLKIATVENDFQSVQVYTIEATHPDFYTSGLSKSDRREFETHFFYGGPKQITHGGAFHAPCDLAIVFLCYCFFFI